MKRTLAALAISGYIFAGCALIDTRPPEEIVAERARQWMDSLIALDYDTAWSLVTPGYKELWSIGHYRARYKGAEWWLEGEMGPVTCTGEPLQECTALLYITYQAPMVVMKTRKTFTTRWLLTDGQWLKYEQ